MSATEIQEARRKIEWVLAHPHMSAWLKQSLSSALDRDAQALLNDLELLNLLIRLKCEAELDRR